MTLIIAHRGASGYEPENTLRAFQTAIKLKADAIECDVRLSIEGIPVVIHDSNTKRTTKKKRVVKKSTVTQLQELDAGKGEKIPTLEEVLHLIKNKIKINIELKERGTAEPVAKLILKYINRNEVQFDDFYICSFNHNELQKFHDLMPQIKIGVLYRNRPQNYIKTAKKLNAYSINLNLRQIAKRRIQKAHQHNLKVFAWTVNKPKQINKLKELQVDGIITDYPDIVNVRT